VKASDPAPVEPISVYPEAKVAGAKVGRARAEAMVDVYPVDGPVSDSPVVKSVVREQEAPELVGDRA